MRDNASNAAFFDAFFWCFLRVVAVVRHAGTSAALLAGVERFPPLSPPTSGPSRMAHTIISSRDGTMKPLRPTKASLDCLAPSLSLYSDVEVVGNEGPRGLGDARLLSCRSPLFMLMAASRPVQNAGLTRYDRCPSYALRCIHSSPGAVVVFLLPPLVTTVTSPSAYFNSLDGLLAGVKLALLPPPLFLRIPLFAVAFRGMGISALPSRVCCGASISARGPASEREGLRVGIYDER